MAPFDRLGGLASETTLAIKAPCLVATTGSNITLSGVKAVDGVTVGNSAERVLVKDQTDATQNGIYVASSGNWTLAQDADGNTDWVKGTQVLVVAGTINAGLVYQQTASAVPIIIGTTALAFSVLQFNVSRFIGTNTAPIDADGAQVVVQNSSLTQAEMFDPVTGGVVYDGVRSTIYIPPGSTALQGNSFGAYVRSRSGTGNSFGNGVLFYGLATAAANNTAVWGANFRIIDTEDVINHNVNSFTGVQLLGIELDYYVTSPTTVVEGIGIELQATTNWTGGGAGFQITNITPQFGKLNFAFVSGNAVAANALSVGALDGSATAGVGGPSQVVSFNWWDKGTPSVNRASSLYADAAGNLNWSFTSSGSSGLFLNAAANTQLEVGFQQAGSPKWQIGALSNGDFFAFDFVANALTWQMPTGGDFAFTPAVKAASFKVGANQVVGARVTGWNAPTTGGGAISRGTFDTGATLLQTAETLAAVITDLRSHGLIGT